MRFYIFFQNLKKVKIKILWKSMQKDFLSCGHGNCVVDLPNVKNPKYIRIGDNCFFGSDITLEAWDKYSKSTFTPKITIGNNVVIADRFYLSCIDEVAIHDGVLIGRDVFISDNSHGDSSGESVKFAPVLRPLTSKGPVIIGRNVWLGRNVTILSGVTIGDNTIIGANSLVNRSIPSNCIACGTPVKVIKVINGERNGNR